MSVPRPYFRKGGFFAHVLGIPVFVMCFLLLFWPAGFRHYDVSFSRYSFHATIIACIILGVLLISRFILRALSRNDNANWMQCYLFSMIEVVFSSGFCALYLWLVSHKAQAYFWYFGNSLIYLGVLMLIAYVIIDLYYAMVEKDEKYRVATEVRQGEKIRFLDERGNLKLLVAPEAILYIQSDENYLKICYLEDEKITVYTLRNSMKRIEELCAKNGLVRCHRSYFVNKTHVKVLQKEKDFTYAVLDVPNAAHIPVSKNYYDQLSAIL